MKIFFVIGVLLMLFGMAFGVIVGSKSNEGTELSEGGVKLVRWSILIGFALMILSGVLYLRS